MQTLDDLGDRIACGRIVHLASPGLDEPECLIEAGQVSPNELRFPDEASDILRLMSGSRCLMSL